MVNRRNLVYLVVFIWGNLAFLGYIFRADRLASLATLTAASPLPIVFSGANGIEQFANAYYISWSASENSGEKKLGSEDLIKVGGPFNLSSSYAAAIGYGPYLPKETVQAVLNFGFCKRGRLARALGIQAEVSDYLIYLETRDESKEPWKFVGDCTQ